ncbi:crossover junction endodeoxyribonuclease RuvC [Alicyclobacillus vulcanalis]|nr:crossover junction endodeoxyribonuclease RuvC [Alicyclobacillus vulcanalis]
MRILGVDPGLARLGFGIIERGPGDSLRHVAHGCIETEADAPLPERLQRIFHRLTELCREHQPSVMAVEELFFSRNTTTAFTVGQARGVALLAGAEAGIAVMEYTPMQVKQAVTGYGRADKRQIQDMVRILLRLSSAPKPDDAADALAVAIAHAHTGRLGELEARLAAKNRTGWVWERGRFR